MKVTIEKQDNHSAVINLELPSEQASQEYNKAWKRLGQKLNIPGFRRGKAPRGMVEKAVGVDRIKQEAMDRLFPHMFADAISEHELDIVAPPQIQHLKFDLNDGIEVKASVELRPEAKLPELNAIKIEVPEYKLPEDSEEKEIQALLERMTTLEPVIDRETKASDIVSLDFAGYVNGEEIKGGSAKNYRLDLANNNFIEGFSDQLVGHKLGEEFAISVTFPENYHDKNLAGKPAEFKVKLNSISEKKMPELDEEFAKKAGPFETVDQLREEIRRLLKEQEEQENNFRKQKAVIDQLVNQAEVEIPDAMVARETQLLKEEIQQRLKTQGLSWDKFVDAQGQEKTLENLKEEAIKRIKTSLVFGQIAKQESFSVTEDEFADMVKELAQMRNVDEKTIMRQLGNNAEAAQALSDQILSQKIVDFLVERAEVTYVPDDQADAENSDKPEKKPAREEAAVAAAIEGEEFDVLEEEA